MNSSTPISLATLARLADPERSVFFLGELANLQDGSAEAVKRFCRSFPSVVPHQIDDSNPASSELTVQLNRETLVKWKDDLRLVWTQPTVLQREIALLGMIHERLNLFWNAREFDLTELVKAIAAGKAPLWVLQPNKAKLREMAQEMKEHFDVPGYESHQISDEELLVDSSPEPEPPDDSPIRLDEFVLILLRAQRIADRMRVCPNSECPASYFLAKRRSQKYCSEVCAVPVQREFKRRWWAKSGEEWRSKRKKSAARKRKLVGASRAPKKGRRK